MTLTTTWRVVALLTTTAIATLLDSVQAFVPRQPTTTTTTTTTRLYLEDRIARLIDEELYRQQHHDDFERDWMEQNREVMLHTLHAHDHEPNFLETDDMTMMRQYRKDRALADRDPQRYCADRCVSTGNCDVYEDLFSLTPQQVLEFCEECVLSEDEDAICNVPEAFFDEDPERAAESKLGSGTEGGLNP
mmetsp:Transcript_6166/g.15752  ORF Transcript_6166/g.15752 Transcript_6166/m.15752 type:complete len:190 (+) Transcript_6166:253-822(+)|eukprot:CAMPEP_0168746748 /NCGR_PEP_ID=MMETSP0724-20121128/15309_1 /TAXON_ID=265536 /ORGANISM="Amphiprora sp., Strain CCMP467" /LENGTH=189 /DNA_ID=CAMNT_0008794533 /DNA_START=221 /DNA_END=790 /DNA_ORIENTATION=-